MPAIRPVNFYLMRHGETTDNALGLISGGGSDPSLTLKGVKQAEIASVAFQRLNPKPTLIVSSGLQRARLTARSLFSGGLIIEDADLNERHLGIWDGKISEAEQRVRKFLENEESADEHRGRVVRAVNRNLSNAGTVLFVCHGGTIRRILEALAIEQKIEIANARIFYASSEGNGWNISELG